MCVCVCVCLCVCVCVFKLLNNAWQRCVLRLQGGGGKVWSNIHRQKHDSSGLSMILCFLSGLFGFYVFKCFNGLAPSYLSELVQPHSTSRALRSPNQLLLAVPRSRLATRGDRAFSVAPKLWTSLPFHVRAAQSVEHFKTLLKTYLFSLVFSPS